MKILVTGATGFVGSHLCAELLRQGYQVIGLSHSGRTKSIESLLGKDSFHLIKGDIRDADFILNAVGGNNVEAVFHFAALLPETDHLGDPFASFEINTRGTLNLLHAASLNHVETFVYASSIDVYSEPPKYLPVDEEHPVQPVTAYGISKLAGELYCNLYCGLMKVAILRFSIIYGEGQDQDRAIPCFINHAVNSKPLEIHGDGMQECDFVDIKDIIRASILVLEKGLPGIYNIGSGESISVIDLAERIISLTCSESKLLFTDKESNKPYRFSLDIQKARRILGFSPRSLDEGLSGHIKEVLPHYGLSK